MTQREMTPVRTLPCCPNLHPPRYMFDARRVESKGGHFIQCRCSCTPKCVTFDLAWAHWHKMHGLRPAEAQSSDVASNVVQLGLRLTGGAA